MYITVSRHDHGTMIIFQSIGLTDEFSTDRVNMSYNYTHLKLKHYTYSIHLQTALLIDPLSGPPILFCNLVPKEQTGNPVYFRNRPNQEITSSDWLFSCFGRLSW
eukprot:sb/3477939/